MLLKLGGDEKRLGICGTFEACNLMYLHVPRSLRYMNEQTYLVAQKVQGPHFTTP